MKDIWFAIFWDHQILFVIFVITNLYFFLCFVLDFLPSLLCRGVRVGVVYSQFISCNSSVEVFCERSLVDIVKILLSEGGDVEQWLEPQNISLCLWLVIFLYLSTLSYILRCHYCSYIYILDIVCVLTLVFDQEIYWSNSTLSLEESWEEVLEPFTGNSTSLLIIHCVLV